MTKPKTLEELTADLDEIRSSMRQTPRRDDDDDEPAPRGKGAEARIATLTAQRNQAEDALKRALANIDGLKAAHKTQLDEVKASAATQVGQAVARAREDLDLHRLGVADEDGVEAVRSAWSRLPEASRPKTAKEWWAAQVESHKAHLADPEKVKAPEISRLLQVYLPRVEEPEKEPEKKPSDKKPEDRPRKSPDDGARKPNTDKAAKVEAAVNGAKTWEEGLAALRAAG